MRDELEQELRDKEAIKQTFEVNHDSVVRKLEAELLAFKAQSQKLQTRLQVGKRMKLSFRPRLCFSFPYPLLSCWHSRLRAGSYSRACRLERR